MKAAQGKSERSVECWCMERLADKNLVTQRSLGQVPFLPWICLLFSVVSSSFRCSFTDIRLGGHCLLSGDQIHGHDHLVYYKLLKCSRSIYCSWPYCHIMYSLYPMGKPVCLFSNEGMKIFKQFSEFCDLLLAVIIRYLSFLWMPCGFKEISLWATLTFLPHGQNKKSIETDYCCQTGIAPSLWSSHAEFHCFSVAHWSLIQIRCLTIYCDGKMESQNNGDTERFLKGLCSFIS